MKLGTGVLFVAIGLVLLWLAVTGRLANAGAAWSALKGEAPAGGAVKPTSDSGAAAPSSEASRIAAALNVPVGFPNFPVLPSLN